MIKAHVHEPAASFGDLHIAIARHIGDHTVQVLHWTDEGKSWDAHDVHGAASEPTMILRLDEAMAVLDALTAHLHGASDTRQLRLDLERERERVDEQTAVIADVVRSLAAKETAA
jgi:hypothetical protein